MRNPYPKNYRELCWELRHLVYNPELGDCCQQGKEILPCIYVQATPKRGKYYIEDTYNGWAYWEIGARDVYSLYKKIREEKGWV